MQLDLDITIADDHKRDPMSSKYTTHIYIREEKEINVTFDDYLELLDDEDKKKD